jgi:hypothetical protein
MLRLRNWYIFFSFKGVTVQITVKTLPIYFSEILGFRTLSIALVLKLVWFRDINFFGSVYPGSMLVHIWNNLLCTIFSLALMDLAWSQVFITRVICDIGCPVSEGPNRIGFSLT